MAAVDPRLREWVGRARSAPPPAQVPVATMRAANRAEASELWGPVEEVDEIVDLLIPDTEVTVRVYRPPTTELLPALVWYHGGGWVVGDLDTHDGLCRAIANRAHAVVVSVDYRLAPEHRFPAALEDAWIATEWVAENALSLGVDANRITIGGDSSGGNLAAAVALQARRGVLPVAGQVLVYPVTDHSFESQSYRELGDGLNLTRERMEWFWDQYLGDSQEGSHQDASPLRAEDHSDLPPALVILAELDPLRAEGEAYVARLREAGVAADSRVFDGMVHGFIRMPALVDDARTAADEIAAFVAAR